MQKAQAIEVEYVAASVADIIGATQLQQLPDLDVARITQLFGPAIHEGDDKRYGPTWAAKDHDRNVWSICTRYGTWTLSGRGLHYPSKPTASATKRFVQHLLEHCKLVR